MTNPQHIEARIDDGEFHYAALEETSSIDRAWVIRRTTGEKVITLGWPITAPGHYEPRFVEMWIAALDETAHHFTATAVQAERERVLAEIDAAAQQLGEFEVWAAGRGGFSLRLHCHTLTSEDGDEVDPEGDSLLDALTYATDALAADPQEQSGSAG